ncbi:MAG: excinuclease ABC subunit UvrC [Candidatus Limnocylindrus sp.]
MIPEAISAALQVLPDAPGVYLFSDAEGKIIYVGKASRLTQRVRSYWHANTTPGAHRIRDAIDQVASLEWTVTDSVKEALLLEATLIRKHLPRYNVRLRDDRGYPYIRVTPGPYPRVERTRRIVRDGSRYFGPYTGFSAVSTAMEAARRLFQFRTCEISIAEEQRALERPCLLFHLKRCQGPCLGNVTVAEYGAEIKGLELFLGGRSRGAVTVLQRRMERASEREAFEDAARLRDAIRALEESFEAQRVAPAGRPDEDILGIARHGERAAIACFQIRDAALVGRDVHRLDGKGANDEELLTAFVSQYYARAGEIPPSIATAIEISDAETASFLSARREARVELRVPLRGDRVRLLRLAERNALEALIRSEAEDDADRERAEAALSALTAALGLTVPPTRIECTDVSTIQGSFTVASLTVAEGGRLAPKEYRRFKIKGVQGQDDFAAHREALTRRFARSAASGSEKAGEAEARAWALPDLLVIDGGRGQVSAAAGVLEAAGLTIPLIGLAKEREEIWFPGAVTPLLLPATDPGLRLLQRLRDEAHRFAIGYHRTLRSRAATASRLDSIPGLGPTRRKALLRHFGSVAGIAAAGEAEIAAVPGIGERLAATVFAALAADRR